MKKLLGLLLLVLFAALAQAEVQTVTINNYDNYGTGYACYVNPVFNGSFGIVYSTVKDQDPSHTSKGAAAYILDFFELPDHGSCYSTKSGNFTLDTPDDSTYVVIILTDGGDNHSATKAYWSIVPIDGSSRNHITVNAPSN